MSCSLVYTEKWEPLSILTETHFVAWLCVTALPPAWTLFLLGKPWGWVWNCRNSFSRLSANAVMEVISHRPCFCAEGGFSLPLTTFPSWSWGPSWVTQHSTAEGSCELSMTASKCPWVTLSSHLLTVQVLLDSWAFMPLIMCSMINGTETVKIWFGKKKKTSYFLSDLCQAQVHLWAAVSL